MKYKALIFDLDGTLLDTLEDLRDAVNFALASEGLPPRTLDEVRTFVGNGIGRLLRLGAGGEPDEAVYNRLFTAFVARYKEHAADKTRPYAGIPELLTELRAEGYRMAVVSNKFDIGAKALCAALLPPVFDAVLGETEGLARKPAPDMVLRAAQIIGAKPEDCLYIGDSEVDLKTAANAGLPIVSVLWGFRTRVQLEAAGAEIFAESPEELLKLLSSETRRERV